MGRRITLLLLSIFFNLFVYADSSKSAYFQQKVDYIINVKLDDNLHFLDGHISLKYQNNSQDTLTFIYMHLWPNAYKDNSTGLARQFQIDGKTAFAKARESERGYIDKVNFTSAGQTLKLEFDPENIDIAKLILNTPLFPSEIIEFESDFRVKIPNAKFSRLGHIGQSYMITQWYPKPAVYDNNGWHQMPYLNQGEFYSEFGSYDVKITLPKNYIVGSTGVLQDNPEEIAWMKSLSEKTRSTETFSSDISFPSSDVEFKTLHFKQEKIHDFAWFADKRFNVLEDEIELPHSKRIVKTRSLFTNNSAKVWIRSNEYLKNAIYYYSLWNGDYPYEEVTAVDGTIAAGGGMEYPMITIIGKTNDPNSLEQVIVHEVGHNWFYGILGSNERIYPWMDEGINSFNEMRYFETINKDKPKADLKDLRGLKSFITLLGNTTLYGKEVNELIYHFTAREASDQGLQLASPEYRSLNYGAEVYIKSALVFDYLRAYLGESVFDSIMQSYFENWKFKHPGPGDIKTIFEKESGQDLHWIFDELLKNDSKLDYSVSGIKKTDEGIRKIILKNRGDINGPVVVSLHKQGEVLEQKWINGFERKFEFESNLDFDEVHIDHDHRMLEFNRNNNVMKANGLFRKVERLRIDLLAGIDDEHYTNVFVMPIAGWNINDGFMPGLAIYSAPLPSRIFRYAFVPMFGTSSETLTGTGFFEYKKLNRIAPFHSVDFGMNINRFNYDSSPFNLSYFKLNPQINAQLKNDRKQESVIQQIQFNGVYLNKDLAVFNRELFKYELKNEELFFTELSYIRKRGTKKNPFNNNITIQQGPEFVKLQFEINQTISYPTKPRAIEFRLFAGAFIYDKGAGPYRFRMSSWSGHQDYMFEHIFPRRNDPDDVFGRQLAIEDGGFKVPTPVGQTDKWLAAVNVKMALPGNLPLSVFGDVGTYSNAADAFTGSKRLMYDAGIMASIIPGIFEIYLPLWVSSDIEQAADLSNIKYRRIQFTLKLNDLNPLKLAKSIAN